MTLEIRRMMGGGARPRKMSIIFGGCIISFLQLSILKSEVCHAFQSGSYGSLQLRGKKVLLSIEKEQFRPNTSLFVKQDDDDGDDDNKKRSYNNDLDIFGQPKDGKKRIFEEEADIRGPDRIKSCIPYILPLIDGDMYGKYIYERVPLLGNLDYVLLRPIVEGFHSVPFLSILLFATFALGTQFMSGSLSREVRFNAQQAVLIDAALILPTLIGDAVSDADANFPRALMEPCSNFVWFAYVSMVIYCVASNLRGKKPDQIPFISGTADYMAGPF